MLQSIARNWWVMLVRGICAIAFGLLTFAWPQLTILLLVTFFGAYALVDGLMAVVAGFSSRESNQRWWEMAIVGVLGIVIGLITFLWPGITAVVLLTLIGIFAIVRGVFEIVAAIKLRKVIEGEWMLGLAGAVSILFGIALLARPGLGALAVAWLIGAFAVVFGLIAVMLSLHLRGLHKRLQGSSGVHVAAAQWAGCGQTNSREEGEHE